MNDRDPRAGDSWNIQARLMALAIVSMGIAGLWGVHWVWSNGPLMPLLPVVPPGLPSGAISVLSPLACLVPVVVALSMTMIAVGTWRFLFPD